MNIITSKTKSWQHRKDNLHKRRKEIIEQLKPGMMSKSQMMRGHDGDGNEEKQTMNYDQWKRSNERNMEEFHKINREFKNNKDEGQVHSLDDIRPDGKMKFN